MVPGHGFDLHIKPWLLGTSGQRQIPFPPTSRPHKALARHSPRCLADANQNHREASRWLSNGFGPANAGGRKVSLKCVLRLPSTPHGVA
ncbi:hypothetical protein PCANC_02025 [Puccinia coronata f. sp. avenae]|uniref:Uncharacterized protein n=1 Tax=Puccinia coronata f. sp. avenae TaxID=200324 RepID=A0A2N5W1Z0_9BASI|nr:hypothetical protein PCANC_02025 [Puccinia coronata f. sp. avenae]